MSSEEGADGVAEGLLLLAAQLQSFASSVLGLELDYATPDIQGLNGWLAGCRSSLGPPILLHFRTPRNCENAVSHLSSSAQLGSTRPGDPVTLQQFLDEIPMEIFAFGEHGGGHVSHGAPNHRPTWSAPSHATPQAAITPTNSKPDHPNLAVMLDTVQDRARLVACGLADPRTSTSALGAATATAPATVLPAPAPPTPPSEPPPLRPAVGAVGACWHPGCSLADCLRSPAAAASCGLYFSGGGSRGDQHLRFLLLQLVAAVCHLHAHGCNLDGVISPTTVLLQPGGWLQLLPPPQAVASSALAAPPPPPPLPRLPFCLRHCPPSLQQLTAAWQHHALSSLDYLMLLNLMAGRRLADRTFHPFVPWVTDFTVPPQVMLGVADAADAAGSSNNSRGGSSGGGGNSGSGGWLDLTQSRYRQAKGDLQLDVTFASSAMPHHIPQEPLSELSFCTYMARVTPRAVLQRAVRSYFEPREYPPSLEAMLARTPDECLPQLYTDPRVFSSMHVELPDLQLPEWATDPQDFIRWHRALLESDRVSSRLHHWIDLFFGHKLLGAAAVAAKNVYLPPQPHPAAAAAAAAGSGGGSALSAAGGAGPTYAPTGMHPPLFLSPHPPRLPRPVPPPSLCEIASRRSHGARSSSAIPSGTAHLALDQGKVWGGASADTLRDDDDDDDDDDDADERSNGALAAEKSNSFPYDGFSAREGGGSANGAAAASLAGGPAAVVAQLDSLELLGAVASREGGLELHEDYFAAASAARTAPTWTTPLEPSEGRCGGDRLADGRRQRRQQPSVAAVAAAGWRRVGVVSQRRRERLEKEEQVGLLEEKRERLQRHGGWPPSEESQWEPELAPGWALDDAGSAAPAAGRRPMGLHWKQRHAEADAAAGLRWRRLDCQALGQVAVQLYLGRCCHGPRRPDSGGEAAFWLRLSERLPAAARRFVRLCFDPQTTTERLLSDPFFEPALHAAHELLRTTLYDRTACGPAPYHVSSVEAEAAVTYSAVPLTVPTAPLPTSRPPPPLPQQLFALAAAAAPGGRLAEVAAQPLALELCLPHIMHMLWQAAAACGAVTSYRADDGGIIRVTEGPGAAAVGTGVSQSSAPVASVVGGGAAAAGTQLSGHVYDILQALLRLLPPDRMTAHVLPYVCACLSCFVEPDGGGGVAAATVVGLFGGDGATAAATRPRRRCLALQQKLLSAALQTQLLAGSDLDLYLQHVLPLLLAALLCSEEGPNAAADGAVATAYGAAAASGVTRALAVSTISDAAAAVVVALAAHLPLPLLLERVVGPLLSYLSVGTSVPRLLVQLCAELGGQLSARHVAPALLQLAVVPAPPPSPSRRGSAGGGGGGGRSRAQQLISSSSSSRRLTSSPLLAAAPPQQQSLSPPLATERPLQHQIYAALSMLTAILDLLPREFIPRAFLHGLPAAAATAPPLSPNGGATAAAAAAAAGDVTIPPASMAAAPPAVSEGVPPLLSCLLDPLSYRVAPGSLTMLAGLSLRAFVRLARPENLAWVVLPHLLPLLAHAAPRRRAAYRANGTAARRGASDVTPNVDQGPAYVSSAASAAATTAGMQRSRSSPVGVNAGGGSGRGAGVGRPGVEPALGGVAAAAELRADGAVDGGDDEDGYWELVHCVYGHLVDSSGLLTVRNLLPGWQALEAGLSSRLGWSPAAAGVWGIAAGGSSGRLDGHSAAGSTGDVDSSGDVAAVAAATAGGAGSTHRLSLSSLELQVRQEIASKQQRVAALHGTHMFIKEVGWSAPTAQRSSPRDVPYYSHGTGGAGSGALSAGGGAGGDGGRNALPAADSSDVDGGFVWPQLLAIGSPTVAEGLAVRGGSLGAGGGNGALIRQGSLGGGARRAGGGGSSGGGGSGRPDGTGAVVAPALSAAAAASEAEVLSPGGKLSTRSRADDEAGAAVPATAARTQQKVQQAPLAGGRQAPAAKAEAAAAAGCAGAFSARRQRDRDLSSVLDDLPGAVTVAQRLPGPVEAAAREPELQRNVAVLEQTMRSRPRSAFVNFGVAATAAPAAEGGDEVGAQAAPPAGGRSGATPSLVHPAIVPARSDPLPAARTAPLLPTPPLTPTPTAPLERLGVADGSIAADPASASPPPSPSAAAPSPSSSRLPGQRQVPSHGSLSPALQPPSPASPAAVGTAPASQSVSRRPSGGPSLAPLLIPPPAVPEGAQAPDTGSQRWSWLPPLSAAPAAHVHVPASGGVVTRSSRARLLAAAAAPPPANDVWNLQASVVHSWPAHRDRIRALAVHPGECAVLTAGRGAVAGRERSVIRVWSLADCQARVQYGGHRAAVQAVLLLRAARADGAVVASLDTAGQLHVWSYDSGQQLACFAAAAGVVGGGSVGAASSAAAAAGGAVGEPYMFEPAERSNSAWTDLMERSRSYTSSQPAETRGWQSLGGLKTGRQLSEATAAETATAAAAAAVSPGGLSSGGSGGIRALATGVAAQLGSAPAAAAAATTPLSSSGVAAAAAAGALSSSGAVRLTGFTSMCCVPEEYRLMYAGTADARLCALDLERRQVVAEWLAAPTARLDADDAVTALCAPGGGDSGPTLSGGGAISGGLSLEVVAAGSRAGRVVVLDRRCGTAAAAFRAHGGEVTSLASGGSFSLITAGADKQLRLWDLRRCGTAGGPSLHAGGGGGGGGGGAGVWNMGAVGTGYDSRTGPWAGWLGPRGGGGGEPFWGIVDAMSPVGVGAAVQCGEGPFGGGVLEVNMPPQPLAVAAAVAAVPLGQAPPPQQPQMQQHLPSGVAAPALLRSFALPREGVQGLRVLRNCVLMTSGSSVGVMPLPGVSEAASAPITGSSGAGSGGVGGPTFSRLRNSRGGRESAAITGLVALPCCRMLVVAGDDGVVRICR